MHELSIAQALVEQLENVALREKAVGISRVVLTIGGLSGVEPEALKLAFPVAVDGSIAEGAELVIDWQPACIICGACGRKSPTTMSFLVCEQCGSTEVTLEGSRDLLLSSVELVT